MVIGGLLFLHDRLTCMQYKCIRLEHLNFSSFPETTIPRTNSEVQGKADGRDSDVGERTAESER